MIIIPAVTIVLINILPAAVINILLKSLLDVINV